MDKFKPWQGRETWARSLKMLATPRLGAVWGGTTLFFPQNAPISAHCSYPWRIVGVPFFANSISFFTPTDGGSTLILREPLYRYFVKPNKRI